MRFSPTKIPEVVLIKPDLFADERGFFFESYRKQAFSGAGIQADFVQDNHSGSTRGVLRGLHYQIRQPQGKLVRVLAGDVYDVAVDLRRSSPSFGCWIGITLSSEDKNQLWIPPGFAHGFYTLSDWAEVFYKTTDYYAPQWDRTLLWNDETLGIDWPISEQIPPVLSVKDMAGKRLSEVDLFP